MKAVILDTNILRGWNQPPTFDEFLSAERIHGIAQLADSWTLFELLTHLADPADKAYMQCLLGIRRATQRSLLDDPPRIVFPAEAQIARLLFGSEPPEISNTMTETVACCRYIYSEPKGSTLGKAAPTLRAIAAHNLELEAFFVEHTRSLREDVHAAPIDSQHGTATKQARAFLRSDAAAAADAASMVTRAYKQMGRDVPEPLPEPEVRKVRDACRTGSAALAIALERILCDGANPDNTRIRNFLWDQEVAFSMGNRIAGLPVLLVSEDPIFKDAAAAVGAADTVVSLRMYLESLGLAAA
jgi:hypothetical protein